MNIDEILSKVDHTVLSPTARWEEVKEAVDDAIRFGTASVCIAPCFVKRAAGYSGGRTKICTVIGFPNGYCTTAAKCSETADAVKNGADEIDMVINLTDLKDGRFDEILNEINEIKKCCDGRTLKVIVETCFLSEDEKVKMCKVVSNSGADFIKTSTGFGTGGATKQDVELFAKHISNGKLIKAAGGIADLKDAEDFIALGASRLGTSRIVKLIKQGGAHKNEKLSDSSY
ncbi:MAG: deoxyribose-phosphate aldolase [Clostridia bacterium]|nr:deoxyribose-phosphate aldolase [Clostridia bacterium]